MKNEVDGVDYHFMDEEKFYHMMENDGLIEWAKFVGNYYGTPKKKVEEMLKEGKNVVLEIEVQGATQVIEMFPNAISVFIVPPSLNELENRIRIRSTESDEIIKERLDKAAYELELSDQYEFVVENKDLDKAVKSIEDIIIKHT